MEWRPNPGPQERFHTTRAYEVFYGGAAGGGKTESLIIEAARFVHVPEYSAVIFRRTFPELRQAHGVIERGRLYFPMLGGRYNEQTFTWRFPSGASIRFGQMEHIKDKYDYQSAEFAFIAFDELTTFEEEQYLYLMSRARTTAIDATTGLKVPVRIRAASNPGNVGHEWVKARFIDSLPPYEVRYFRRIDDVDVPCEETDENALSRQFIPARLSDNPILTSRDPEYVSRLMQLPLIERERLLAGNWDILLEGNIFKPEWFKVIDQAPFDLKWIRYWDLAASVKTRADFTASAALAADREANLYIRDMIRIKAEWPDAKKLIKATIMSEEHVKRTGIETKVHGLAAVQEFARDPDLIGHKVEGRDVDRDKVSRALLWSSRAEQGKVYLVHGPWVNSFLLECSLFDGTERTHDDQIDSVSGGVGMLVIKKWSTPKFLHL